MTTLAAAQAGDRDAFADLVAGHEPELRAYCYRMLGSLDDAEEALQETMLAAWRGLRGFQRRSSLRTWLYRIATNCCLRLASRRPRRMLSWDHGPPRAPGDDLGEPLTEPIWLDPWPDDPPAPDDADPAVVYGRREHIELAYVAALQHLPANQRAVLILRDVLAFPAAEVAGMLDTSPQSVNSALQRARKAVQQRVPGPDQQTERLGAEQRAAVDAFVAAFEAGDVPAIVRLLAADVRFTMPPLPAWYHGREDVATFFGQRVFATPWRAVRITANGQPAVAGYQQVDESFRLGAVTVLNFRADRIFWLASFVDPAVVARFGLPAER